GNQGWVVKGLRANREQIYRNTYNEAKDTTSWYVLPRIRINPADTAIVKNVCRIEVTNFNDSIIKIIDLTTDNFKLQGFSYNGQYIDSFYYLSSSQKITDGRLFNPDSKPIESTNCGVDFRVWYYGEVEMWIDRIRVENDRAHNLLNFNVSNQTSVKYNNWLDSEICFAINNPGKIYKYYVDEVEFNTMPAIKYINHKIDSATNHQSSLMVVLNYDLFKLHLPDVFNSSFSAAEIRKYMIDDAGLNNLFYGQYPLTGFPPPDCYLPN
ncbi:MAG: hypothetical protein NTU73_06825, partial [Ignavibacteriae bacterium]|nr:hypothetical protein [Ignavibacteriota bacterium]